MSATLVIGHFKYLDDAVHAVAKVRDRGEKFESYAPYPEHNIEHEQFLGKRRSPVRMVTLAGAITGCFCAFLMTTWESIDYPIRVSAKPYLSFPSFMIPGFEWTVLFGGTWTLAAIFIFCHMPSFRYRPGYRATFSEGEYGLTVTTTKEKAEELKKLLESQGAHVVEIQYSR